MEQLYLVGEPLLGIESKPNQEFAAPYGQLALCQSVVRETQDREAVLKKLREEYLAIVYTLKEMGIDFRIVYSHPKSVDRAVINSCAEGLGCRVIGFDERFFPPSVAYPRDFATVLPGLILVNPEGCKLQSKGKGGYRIGHSPFGVGGRILHSGKTALVSERVIGENGRSTSAAKAIDVLDGELNLAYYPPPVRGTFTVDTIDERPQFNDHIDRVGCLLHGRDGRLHHIADPHCCVIQWRGRDKSPSWYALREFESVCLMRARFRPLGIVDHAPDSMAVPYSLNLEQFPDGRVLMTSGDPDVEAVVSDIVGVDKVFTTPVPIRYFPVWKYAGIRCLVSPAPMPLLVADL